MAATKSRISCSGHYAIRVESEFSPSLARAYGRCAAIAHAHYENFPVASGLLPASMRPHIAAVYAFARAADDFADEGKHTERERLHLLDDWMCRLQQAGHNGSTARDDDDDRDLIFTALGHTIRVHELPVRLFEDLLSAFRQDVTVHRYDTWQELLDYCRRSANPVGRIVLRIAGCRNPATERSADCVCSALQLANFLQDFAGDWERGRLYVPAEIYAAHGAHEYELGKPWLISAWCDVVSDVAGRTRELFYQGRDVCDAFRGRLRYELRATWLGGVRILDQLERTGYDPVVRRPTIRAADYLPLLWQILTWQSRCH